MPKIPVSFVIDPEDASKLIQYLSGGAPFSNFLVEIPDPVTAPSFDGAAPVIGGSGEIGSPVTVVSDSTPTGADVSMARTWFVDGEQVSTTNEFNFPSPAGALVTMSNVAANGGGVVNSALSNSIASIEVPGAPVFHANFGNALWSVDEDARTPEIQVEFVPEAGFNALFDTVNFRYFFVCPAMADYAGDPTASTEILSGLAPTPRVGGARAAGTTIYPRIYAQRRADGVTQLVSSVKTQLLVGTGGGTVTFATAVLQPNPGKAEALTFAKTKYNQPGSYMASTYACQIAVCNAYNAWKGDAASVTWTIAQIKLWCVGSNGPRHEGGYYGQYDLVSVVVTFLALRTPAVLAGLTAAEQEFCALNIETALYTAAVLHSEANAISPKRTLRGRTGEGYLTVNPNISQGSRLGLLAALIHFGIPTCMTKLAAFDKVAWRQTLLDNGLMPTAAMTYSVSPTPLSSPGELAAPTNAQMKTALGPAPEHLYIQGNDIATAAGAQAMVVQSLIHCFGGNADGTEDSIGSSPYLEQVRILPGVKYVQGGARDGLLGIPHANSGGRRGYRTGVTNANYAATLAAMPFGGERGCIKEMMCVDAGGIRSSCSYASHTMRITADIILLLMVGMPSWWDWRSGDVVAVLERARRGWVHYRWAACDNANPYLNVAKASLTGSANTNSETWSPASHGDRDAFNATLGMNFDVILKWMRDSSILAPLAGGMSVWEDPINLSY